MASQLAGVIAIKDQDSAAVRSESTDNPSRDLGVLCDQGRDEAVFALSGQSDAVVGAVVGDQRAHRTERLDDLRLGGAIDGTVILASRAEIASATAST